MTLVGSHKLMTDSDVPVATAMQDNRAVVTLGQRKVTVEFDKGRILIDETDDVKLPAETKDVGIEYAGGNLKVTADGWTVFPRREREYRSSSRSSL